MSGAVSMLAPGLFRGALIRARFGLLASAPDQRDQPARQQGENRKQSQRAEKGRRQHILQQIHPAAGMGTLHRYRGAIQQDNVILEISPF